VSSRAQYKVTAVGGLWSAWLTFPPVRTGSCELDAEVHRISIHLDACPTNDDKLTLTSGHDEEMGIWVMIEVVSSS
jgi:hypothetical protein